MNTYEHDGCIDCKYYNLNGNEMPCKICKQNIHPCNEFRNKAPDMYEPTEQMQKQSKLPNKIDRPNFERQLESYSVRAFVQQFKYLACKINEILTYLKESM